MSFLTVAASGFNGSGLMSVGAAFSFLAAVEANVCFVVVGGCCLFIFDAYSKSDDGGGGGGGGKSKCWLSAADAIYC